MQSIEPLVVRKSERMPKTRQKKREQEQEKKIEQEQKEAEAEDFLLARRVEDGQVRPWSQETQARLRIQDVEDAIKNSQDSQGQIQHQRYVVEAKEELERREAEKERMEAELEEEERRQMEEEEEERRLLSERKRRREKSRERVKHSISKLSIQVKSWLNVTKPVVEDERRMQIQTELAAEQTRLEQLEARLDQVGEGLAEALRDVRVDIMEEEDQMRMHVDEEQMKTNDISSQLPNRVRSGSPMTNLEPQELTPRRMELEALPEVDRVRRQLDERLAELDIEDQLDVEREKKQVKASEEKTRARQKKREQATLKFEERMEQLLGKIWDKLAKDIESARREEKEIEEFSGYPIVH